MIVHFCLCLWDLLFFFVSFPSVSNWYFHLLKCLCQKLSFVFLTPKPLYPLITKCWFYIHMSNWISHLFPHPNFIATTLLQIIIFYLSPNLILPFLYYSSPIHFPCHTPVIFENAKLIMSKLSDALFNLHNFSMKFTFWGILFRWIKWVKVPCSVYCFNDSESDRLKEQKLGNIKPSNEEALVSVVSFPH